MAESEVVFKCYRCGDLVPDFNIHVCSDLLEGVEGAPQIPRKPLCPDHGDMMRQYWLGVWQCVGEVDGGPNCGWLVMTADAFAAWTRKGDGPLPREHGLAPPPRNRPDGAPCCWKCNDVGVVVELCPVECTCRELMVPSLQELHDEDCPVKHPQNSLQYKSCPVCFGYGNCDELVLGEVCGEPIAYNTLKKNLSCTAAIPHSHSHRYE